MYESNPGTVTTTLSSSSAEVFSPAVIASILSLATNPGDALITVAENVQPSLTGAITVPAGTELVFINPSPGVALTSNTPIPVLILQGTTGATLTVNAGPVTTPSAEGKVDRVVVGTAGADQIVIADARNSKVIAGEGDTVQAGGGADTIVAAQGDSTIIGGTGHAIVSMKGTEANYSVTVRNGHAIVESGIAGQTVDISKIQYVMLDGGDALVFAKNSKEAAVTTLYETAFGRTADATGLQHWFNRAAAGDSLTKIADAFTKTPEFAAEAALSNTAFVNQLYLHTFGRAAETAGVAYWSNALANGASRADLIVSFSTIASNHLDGTQTTNLEAEIVGSVTIVQNII